MKKSILTYIFLLASFHSVTAAGETKTYLFLPDQSTVVQTGGLAGIHETHSVAGRFQLTVDFETGVASFDQVDAILSESPFLYTQSLDVLFNMTELVGTVISDTEINFIGKTAETHPVDVNLVVTFRDNSVEMTGGTFPPCCDFFIYNLDAVAHEFPQTYYVDGVNGDDNNDGLSPKTAFTTIQKGIDMAEDGDTVIVLPCLYTESINFLAKNITLKSTNPTNSNIVKTTTIEGMVMFRGTEKPNCTLTGFGFDWEIDPNGENHTHATISHCVLENFITGCGRLIYACDGTISNCTVANIGYMCMRPSPVPAIVGCHGLIENCTFVAVMDGIEVFEGGTCTIKNCILYHHTWALVPAGATLNILYSNPGISTPTRALHD
ncbi:MAG: right-handed parallel beta-helix repeat-containing protein [Planctomycetota bacterium]